MRFDRVFSFRFRRTSSQAVKLINDFFFVHPSSSYLLFLPNRQTVYSWFRSCGRRLGCCMAWALFWDSALRSSGPLRVRFCRDAVTKRRFRGTLGFSGQCYKWGSSTVLRVSATTCETYRFCFLLHLPLPPSSRSMFFGNLFVYFQFQGKTHIDEATRTLVFSVLIGVGFLGFFFLTALRPLQDTHVVSAGDEVDDELDTPSNGVAVVFQNSINLFMTKEMLLLNLAFFYTGEWYALIMHNQ